MMKKLATEYKRLKNNSNTNNNYYLLNSFYDEKKILFPWLKKESFRWHVRQSENNETPPDSTDESIIICTTTTTFSTPGGHKGNSGSLNITQSQVRT